MCLLCVLLQRGISASRNAQLPSTSLGLATSGSGKFFTKAASLQVDLILILTIYSYTDFLVYEIRKDGTTVHLHEYEEQKPSAPKVCCHLAC